jgi:hypothetical protein
MKRSEYRAKDVPITTWLCFIERTLPASFLLNTHAASFIVVPGGGEPLNTGTVKPSLVKKKKKRRRRRKNTLFAL